MIEIPFSQEEGIFFVIAGNEAIKRFIIFFRSNNISASSKFRSRFPLQSFLVPSQGSATKKGFSFQSGLGFQDTLFRKALSPLVSHVL